MSLGVIFLGCMFFCLFVMAVGAAGQGPNAGVQGFLALSFLAFLGAFLVALGGEGSGLMALVQTGNGLKDGGTAGWAKLCLVLIFVLPALTMVGVCGLAAYAADGRPNPGGAVQSKPI